MRTRAPSLIIVMGLLLLPLGPLAQAKSARFDVWVENALRTIYRTSTIPQNAGDAIRVVSARNEYESAQIALRSTEPLTISRVRFSDLVSASGEVIDNKHLRHHFEEYEDTATVQPNAFFPDRVGRQLYPQSALPDPLSNDHTVKVEADSTQPILVTSYVPSGTSPGTYEGTTTVETTRGNRVVPIRVSVFDVTVPATSDATIDQYHWTMTNGFTWDGLRWNGEGSQAYDVGQHYYGVKAYSDKWFTLMDNFAQTLAEYRTTMVWIRTDLLLQATGTELSEFTEGVPDDLDWSVFDRYVETFRRHGITAFANQHLIHTLNKMPDSEKPDASWNTGLPDELPVTDAYLENYLTALNQHLQEKGWAGPDGGTWYQHILDEPITDAQKNWWTYVARKIKQINAQTGAEFRTMDADPNGILLGEQTKDYVDTWVPLTPAFEAKKEEYKAQQAAGQDLWVYTCEVNTPPWLNRFWSQPTLTGRLLFWNLQRQGVQGHLHWAWNAWYVGPWNGDSYIVYPDKEHLTVKSSLRYEAHRDGLEDYELLHQLQQRNPELARRIADSAVSPEDPRKYTLDPAYIKALHDYVVQAAAGVDAGDVPDPTSPYPDQEMPSTYLVDDTDTSLTYDGDWFSRKRQYAYLGAVTMSETADDALAYTFDGSGIDVIVEKGTTSGKVSVSVDGGEPEIIDLYEAVRYDYATVFGSRALTAGVPHTIRVVNLDGKELRLDGLRVHLHPGQQHGDASLESLDIPGVRDYVFDGRLTTYRLLIPEERDSVTVTPSLTDPEGSLTINGTQVTDGATVSVDVPVGKSTLRIRTTAGDGTTSMIYTVEFVKGAVNTPGTNVSRSYSTVTASATRSGEGAVVYGPQKMVDGDSGTMFAAEQGYTDAHPFPHEIVTTWDQPQSMNTLVMQTPSGVLQGITDVDVQTSTDGSTWTTVARGVQLRWTRDEDDGVMESVAADLPELDNVTHLRMKINDANYTTWSMYAVYELELYDLPDHGEIAIG
ncbi:glycoside hydrolase domain-containing protein [Actinopolymorpha sp. B11F2]|uniref:glycoside hydrolase domain-containing protein n=1 Tax=Actinopolymorpha sp. B11F2 TaxID=3160862 RepID=UPI0032E3B5C0